MRPIGVGIDIVKNSRMAAILSNSTKMRFLDKALHPEEIEKLLAIEKKEESIKMASEFLASRWAVKEALVKASSRKDVLFHEVLIKTLPSGKPDLQLENVSKKIIAEELGCNRIDLSLSHEDEFSVAVVNLYGKF